LPNPARLPPSTSASSSDSSPRLSSALLPGTGLSTLLPEFDLTKYVSPSSVDKIWKQQRRASRVIEGVSAVLWGAFVEGENVTPTGITTSPSGHLTDVIPKEDDVRWNW
jgi:hypothetical protein